MDLIDLLHRAATSIEPVLARLAPSERERRTPCPEMTVAQVADHLNGGLEGFAVVGEGGELSFEPAADAVSDHVRPAERFRVAVDHLTAVFAQPGRLDATYRMPWGPTTGAQLIGFELIETIVHGWDVARGLGIEPVVDDDLAQATLDGARMWVDESVRVPGMFGAEVATDSTSPLDQLVAFLGRDPRWHDT
ncbi:MAG: TIGR03086 family metal-binding protein [Acidimicrobiales bacterium]